MRAREGGLHGDSALVRRGVYACDIARQLGVVLRQLHRPSIGGRQVCLAEQGLEPARRHTGAMPRRLSWPSTIAPPPNRCRHTCWLGGDVSHAAGGGELVLTQAAGTLPRAPRQAETAGSGHASGPRPALTPAVLARAPDSGPARLAYPVASSGLAAPLAVEVAAGTASDSEGVAATDREHDSGEPDLGRRTDRERTAPQIGTGLVAAHGGSVHAESAPAARRAAIPALGDVYAESCACGRGL